MSTFTSCTLLTGRPAAAASPRSSAASRLLQSGKAAAAVALPSFQKKARPLSVCSANNQKADHGPKTDLPPFNIPPFALVHPVSPREERWQMEEEAEAVNMWFEVPGLSKEDLVVELDEDVLVIRKKPKAEQQLGIDILDQQRAATNYRAGRETASSTVMAGGGAGGAGAAASYNKQATSRDVTLASAASRVDGSKVRADAAAAAAQDGGGVYARLLVPAGYSRECIEAELASGVLRVTIGKVKEHARRRISVEIHVK